MENKEKFFTKGWLDSSYQETLLPSTPWQNVSDMLSLDLAQAVRKQFSNPHRRQIIIELLGSQFKRSYLSEEPDTPQILFDIKLPPNMTEEQRKKLENEAKSWLQIQINEIAIKKGCALKSDQNEDSLCNEMKDYLEHTYNIVSTSFDRHLYLKQDAIEEKMRKAEGDSKKPSKTNDLRQLMRQKNSIKEKSAKFQGNLSSEYTAVIADSLLCILQKDPRRIAFVLQKLMGQQLPDNLRKFIWSDILMRHERKKIESSIRVDIDLYVRKNFAFGVTRGKNELKLSDPSQTPIAGLIENAVIETYSRVHSLNEFLNEAHLRQTMKVLNLLYTYSRDYEPYFIYWLLPFQLTFYEDKNKSELIYDLAMYLDLFVKNLFPPWNEIFTISGKIVQDLSMNDPIFYEHLKKISKVNPKVNQKDFVNEIIYNEGKKTFNQFINNNEENNPLKTNKEILTEPSIFIRKWIGECFSSVLRKNALMYVWDQLFMSLWSSTDFEMIAKALLYLLKTKFMLARDHDEMRRVFLDEPCKLYTSDIQSAFMHLSSGRKESEVTFLNRRDTENAFDYTGYYARPDDPASLKKSVLEPIGFKDIDLTLLVPKLTSLSDFDPNRVTCEFRLYYGELKLGQKLTDSIPLVKDIRSSLYDSKTYDLTIMNDKIVFDVFEFDQEPYALKDVFALVIVKYLTVSRTESVLGYCKFSLYSPQRIGSVSTWEVIQGKVMKLLHPGSPPANPDSIGDIPNNSYKDRLGPGSNLKLTVFDAKSEEFFKK